MVERLQKLYPVLRYLKIRYPLLCAITSGYSQDATAASGSRSATPPPASAQENRRKMRPTVLAMDLEGTLISNAVSQIPRPGLFQFLETVSQLFERLVIYTTVPEATFRQLACLLVAEGCVPGWFAELHYTEWDGSTKDLRRVSPHPDSTLLLDDYGAYVHPGQEDCWIQVPLFGAPYHENDRGLEVALDVIRARLDTDHQRDRHSGSGASAPPS